MRDQDDNRNAAVAAARSLEQITDVEVSRPQGSQTVPGFIIVINGPSAHLPRPPTIEATPVLDDAEPEPVEALPVRAR